MKRDMASLLEQTVEYINTMHTVLNEEKPACLSKVYLIYQKKIEEHDFCRKSCTPKSTKRKLSSGGSCSHGSDHQQTSPLIYQAYPEQTAIDTDAKRHCSSLAYDQSVVEQGMSTPNGSYIQSWQPQQQIIEPMGNINNNNFMPSFLSCGSECRGSMLNSSHFIFGQSPLTNQYGISHKQPEQYSPYTTPKFLAPFTKMCAGLPKPVVPCGASPSIDHHHMQGEMMSGECSSNSTISDQPHKSGISVEDMIVKTRKSQNFLNVSSLVGNNDQRDVMQMTNPSPWRQHDFTSVVPFNPMISKSDNPTHNLLAPMDMSLSPPTDAQSTSPQFMGVNKLLGRGFTTNRDMGIVMRPSSVSTMLNEVTGLHTTDYSSKYGSTDHKVTPMFSSTKWSYPQPMMSQNDILPSAISMTIGGHSNTIPVSTVTSEISTPVSMKYFFATPTSSATDKLADSASVNSNLKSESTDEDSLSRSSSTSAMATVAGDTTPDNATQNSESNSKPDSEEKNQLDENNNVNKESTRSSSTSSVASDFELEIASKA